MGACPPVGYVPRPTATSDLRRIVAAHLPAFVERIEHDGGTLPGFVTAELEGVLRCGDFEHGFLRLCCTHRHHLRPRIAPTPQLVTGPPVQLRLFDFAGKPSLLSPSTRQPKLDGPSMHRRSWACLLARVFAIDITTCPCGGRLKIVDVVVDPDEIALHLHGARAPPRPPPHGQLSLLPT